MKLKNIEMNKFIFLTVLMFLTFKPEQISAQINYRFCDNTDYSLADIIHQDGVLYNRILSSGYTTITTPGTPALPVKYVNLLLPPNCIASKITINIFKQQKQRLVRLIEPAQYFEPDSMGFASPQSTKLLLSKKNWILQDLFLYFQFFTFISN